MDTISISYVQKILDSALACKNQKCVYDSFSESLSKNLREEIFVFLSEQGEPRVLRTCEIKEKSMHSKASDQCFVVRFAKAGDLSLILRHESGKWKLLDTSRRSSPRL